MNSRMPRCTSSNPLGELASRMWPYLGKIGKATWAIWPRAVPVSRRQRIPLHPPGQPQPRTAPPKRYRCPPGQVTSGIFTTTPSLSMSSSRLANAACTSAEDFRTRADRSFFQVTTVTARNGLYAGSPGG